MPPSCCVDALTAKILESWVPELQQFSPQGYTLKTMPHQAISQASSQNAGGQDASLAALSPAPLFCSEGTSSTSPPPPLPVGQLLLASCSSLRFFASSCQGAQVALQCVGVRSLHLFFLAAKQACKSPALPHAFFPPSQLQLSTPSAVLTRLLVKPPLLARFLKCPAVNWGTARKGDGRNGFSEG